MRNLAILPTGNSPLKIKDKDGDDGGPVVETYLIECALDGFMITINYDDGTSEKYVRNTMDEIISLIRAI